MRAARHTDTSAPHAHLFLKERLDSLRYAVFSRYQSSRTLRHGMEHEIDQRFRADAILSSGFIPVILFIHPNLRNTVLSLVAFFDSAVSMRTNFVWQTFDKRHGFCLEPLAEELRTSLVNGLVKHFGGINSEPNCFFLSSRDTLRVPSASAIGHHVLLWPCRLAVLFHGTVRTKTVICLRAINQRLNTPKLCNVVAEVQNPRR